MRVFYQAYQMKSIISRLSKRKKLKNEGRDADFTRSMCNVDKKKVGCTKNDPRKLSSPRVREVNKEREGGRGGTKGIMEKSPITKGFSPKEDTTREV